MKADGKENNSCNDVNIFDFYPRLWEQTEYFWGCVQNKNFEDDMLESFHCFSDHVWTCSTDTASVLEVFAP